MCASPNMIAGLEALYDRRVELRSYFDGNNKPLPCATLTYGVLRRLSKFERQLLGGRHRKDADDPGAVIEVNDQRRIFWWHQFYDPQGSLSIKPISYSL